jgi:arylsulfatase A-like enzyme
VTPRRPRDLLLFSVWLGTIYGLLEALILQSLVEFSALDMWRNGVNPRILWVAPAVNAAAFGLAGLLLAAVLRLTPERRKPWTWTLAIALLAGAAGFGLVMTPRAITRSAVALVTIGALVRGFQMGRARTEFGFARRTLVRVVAIAIVAGGAAEVWMWDQERRALAALPPARPGSPNVLILILDTARADHLSSYGYDRATTPHIDGLAREGMLFERAYSTSHWSSPGHIAILEGHYDPGRVPSRFRPRSATHFPLAEVLARRGYATFASSANNMWFTPKAGFGYGFSRFEVYFHTVADTLARTFYGKMPLVVARDPGGWFDAPWRKRAPESNRELLDWIDRTRQLGRPFFAVVNYMDAHDPYWPPEPFTHRFNPTLTRRGLLALHSGSHPKSNLTPAQWQMVVDAYDSSLAYLDAALGDLFTELKRRGSLDDTILVITADHGEALGEEGRSGHVAPILRQEVTRVPLIVRFPRAVSAGQRIRRPVSLRQIPATITALLGLTEDRTRYAADPLLAAAPAADSGVLIRGGSRRAIAFERWFLIEHPGQQRRFLYDMELDEKQTTNLSGRPELDAIERMLMERLLALRKTLTPGRMSGEEVPLPPR